MKTIIIGLGLIGGSLALELKKRKFASTIIGVDNDLNHCQQAINLGLVDRVEALETAIKGADLIVLAIPVNAIIQLLPSLLTMIESQTVVTDMGSTKQQIIESVEKHPNRAQFVAAHPMAGTEKSGPEAAIYNLYDHKVAIICDQNHSAPNAVILVEQLFDCLNMRRLYMGAAEHDMHAAYVSHISHISSFVLAQTVLEKEKSTATIFDLASGGFESTVRLAKSSPEMWADIFQQNSTNVIEVLDTYITQLNDFRNKIAEGDFQQLKSNMAYANTIKKILSR